MSQEKRIIEVSWIPSSNEDESDIGSEKEQELGESERSEIYWKGWSLSESEGEKGYFPQPEPIMQLPGKEDQGSRKSIEDLGEREVVIQENSGKSKEMVGMEEVVETATLDERNFIRVVIDDEPYLALLDLGSTTSLVGPPIFKIKKKITKFNIFYLESSLYILLTFSIVLYEE